MQPDQHDDQSTQRTRSDTEVSFTDYQPPPEVKIPPPAKYKLWLIVFVLVYFASWVADEANFLRFLRFRGWLSPDTSLFVMLGVIVFVLVYSTLDLVIHFLSYKTKSGKSYGIEAWLKMPRTEWVYKRDSFFFDCCARIIYVLEEGFSMFDAPPVPEPAAIAKQFSCSDGNNKRTLLIEHRIKPDKVEEYNRWTKRVREAVDQQNGLLKVKRWNEKAWDEEKGMMPEDEKQESSELRVVKVEFANIGYLNDWMLSARRKALMKALDPYLAAPDVVKVQGGRLLPDAFSDLLTRQGKSVSKSPPKKWKVWWLTLLALFVTRKWVGHSLSYYFLQWDIHKGDMHLERLISSMVVTFVNSYVMTPIFLFVFDHWLHRKDVAIKNTRQPWKVLDDGLESTLAKVCVSFLFYGGCLIAYFLQEHTF